MGGNQDVGAAVGLDDGHQLIALAQIDGPDAAGPDVPQLLHRHALAGALAGDHGELQAVDTLAAVTEMEHGLHPLVGLDLDAVHQGDAFRRLAALGNLIALLAVHLAGVGEEQQIIVGGGGEHVHDAVLVPGGDALLAHAALALGGVLADGGTLDVAVAGEGVDTLLLLDEVLNVDLILHVLDLRLAVVAVLVGNGLELLFQNLTHQAVVGQHTAEIGDFFL